MMLGDLLCNIVEANVEMKWKILSDSIKERGRNLAKYMNKIIYTGTTDYQEKRKCVILIYVIM